MITNVTTSAGSQGTAAAGAATADISDNARAQQILAEVMEEQAAIQATLSGVSSSVLGLVTQMDPGLIGYA